MKSIKKFLQMKKQQEPIVMVTAYDYPSGRYAEAAEIDLILTGDSLGMVILGYTDTLQVTLEDMIHHTRAARRGATDTFLIADMPHMSYHISIENTKINASRLIKEGRANAVKLEGGKSSRLEAIKAIVDCEIPVCAHLGLTPQSINTMGGYRIQGKEEAEYQAILQQALAIEDAGAFMLVLEGIPERLGKEITEKLCIPTIGIGAGRYTDGQVLVYHDLLGMCEFKPKFVKQYANIKDEIISSISKWKAEVKDGTFPAQENIYIPLEK
ncbi:MAG: 3-methyl-2-oxobutanoate hydroxymethyltransferase [Candidatus Cloacimonetes bacterium]|nr:3-methyl-2-oxobutanoate hydroxymethyltransferase [Candidatus Cloacimonadota bacterium]